jgi:hypothetical protein
LFTPLGSALAASTAITTTSAALAAAQPTITDQPTTTPDPTVTAAPTVSAEPTTGPTVSAGPTAGPTASDQPTASPDPSGTTAPPLPGAPSTSFSYVSASGDKIGQGGNGTFTDSVFIEGSKQQLRMTVPVPGSTSPWNLTLSPGWGDVLRPGNFENAAKRLNGKSPILDVQANGMSCQEIFGNFTVHQIAYTEDSISMADVTFTVHCDAPTAPALEGTIHLNQLPLSYRQVSDAGDPVGGGVSKTYLNSTSLLALESPNTKDLRLTVSGLRDEWHGTISPPRNQQLTVGQTYQTLKAADATHAGLDISGTVGIQRRRCANSSGTLRIDSLEFSPSRGVSSARIAFVQQCTGATGALRGTLEYVARPEE